MQSSREAGSEPIHTFLFLMRRAWQLQRIPKSARPIFSQCRTPEVYCLSAHVPEGSTGGKLAVR